MDDDYAGAMISVMRSENKVSFLFMTYIPKFSINYLRLLNLLAIPHSMYVFT